MGARLKPGQELYSVATGKLNPFLKASRDAVVYMGGLEGFEGVFSDTEHGCLLWFFDTENHAKQGRNLAEAKGIICGTNIGRFVVADDGVPEADVFWLDTDGRRKGL